MSTHDPFFTPELNPCPFCGGKGMMRDAKWGGRYVSCYSCCARTQTFTESPYVEPSPHVFVRTNNLMAARAWNSRPEGGTFSCPECGVAVPHRHEQRPALAKLYAEQMATFVVLTEITQ